MLEIAGGIILAVCGLVLMCLVYGWVVAIYRTFIKPAPITTGVILLMTIILGISLIFVH